MHYIAILAFVGFVTLATGGHSATFGRAYDAVVRGDVDKAMTLFTTALRSTIQDADTSGSTCESPAKIVLIQTANPSGPVARCG